MKILAVGDIHTKTWILDKVEKVIDKYDAVVFCGDYADDWDKNGLESVETWEKLYQMHQKYGEKIRPVLGNHDYIYVNRTPTLQTGYSHLTQLAINSPANRYLHDWLSSLPITREIDGVTFSHAGLARGYEGGKHVEDLWNDNSPIWVRPDRGEYEMIPQVVGHTPQKTCTELFENIWFIDTFSTYSDGQPIGDGTVLEIKDGKKFKVVEL